MKILNFTLKKKWFDLIKSGKKKKEYREDKPYWNSRLVNEEGVGKEFDIVRFRNGRRADSPTVDVEFKGISFTKRKWIEPAEHGEELPRDIIVIRLGRVIDTQGKE